MTEPIHSRNREKCHVLLIEDNPSDARLLCLSLEESGFGIEVTHLPDASEGLDFLRGRGKFLDARPPSLILLDMNLPKLGGEEFLAGVKRTRGLSTIPVIAISGSVDQSDVRRAYALGVNAYLRKPLDLDQLTGSVRLFAQFWFGVAELPDDCSADVGEALSA